MSEALGYSTIPFSMLQCAHGVMYWRVCDVCVKECERKYARPETDFTRSIDAAAPWWRCCNECDFWLGEHREWCQWRAFDEAVSGDLAAQVWEECPYVCPGCHAVAPERCAPGCIDAEIEEDARHEREPGCLCHWEEGDSPCPVHDEDEEDGGGLEREP